MYIEEYQHNLSSLSVNDILQDLIDQNITGNQKHTMFCPKRNGIFHISANSLKPFAVLCNSDIAGPGWMVALKRSDGETNFIRKWKQYQEGFGNLSSEFFIGLEKLHVLTYEKPHEVYFFLEDFEGNTRYARYDDFLVSNETSFYTLEKLGEYSGDAGDAMSHVAGQRFYTFDNDSESPRCAALRASAGWFNSCTKCNLFGPYLEGYYDTTHDYRAMWWEYWRGDLYSLKSVQMMIRPKCSC
ncbi:microfibril-associated glycoprotein 4-like [Drosophila nasuta]|uniref:microfibril-associated glycoprotein 4-like n=1 Tax=Drosophila nasuta TaxID=42062 RepID=UPI00295E6769|nr:microfibril-associated glycoprotein 4-like [Drosophila nasuta]